MRGSVQAISKILFSTSINFSRTTHKFFLDKVCHDLSPTSNPYIVGTMVQIHLYAFIDFRNKY